MPEPLASVDFDHVHHVELPAALERRDHGAASATYLGGGKSLALRLADGRAATYRTEAGPGVDPRVRITPGDDASVVVELDAVGFGDLLAQRWTIFGLLYPGRLRVVRGTVDQFSQWEPVLQSLWFDRPIYDDSVAGGLRDRDGTPLDVARSYRLDDDPEQLAHVLATAGFLVLRQVFPPAEIAELDAEARRLRAAARPDDHRSWWAVDRDGREVCCRLTYTSERSERIASLLDDLRIRSIAALHPEPLRPAPDRLDGVSVVIKNPAVVQGLSDLPWHRDCGMGGHPVLCPSLNIGIQLDRADARNGQLCFLAGSHHHANAPGDVDAHPHWPVVAVEADPGDVTVHYAHVLHGAPPPTAPDAGRRAMYVSVHPETVFHAVPPGKGYNDVVYSQGDGRVRAPAELG